MFKKLLILLLTYLTTVNLVSSGPIKLLNHGQTFESVNIEYVMPPDFTPMVGLYITIPHDPNLNSGLKREWIPLCSRYEWAKSISTVIKIANDNEIPVIMILDKENYKELKSWFSDWTEIDNSFSIHYEILQVPAIYRAGWSRDYLHGFVKGKGDSAYSFLNTAYAPEIYWKNNFMSMTNKSPFADAIKTKEDINNTLHLQSAISFSNVIVNGNGVCITNEKTVHDTLNAWKKEEMNTRSEENYVIYTEENAIETMVNEMAKYMGCKEILLLETLKNERSGNVRFYMYLISPNDLVYFSYESKDDPINSEIMKKNRALLSQHFIIHDMEMQFYPTRLTSKYSRAGTLQLNDVLLVPTYKSMNLTDDELLNDQKRLQAILDQISYAAKEIHETFYMDETAFISGSLHRFTASMNMITFEQESMIHTKVTPVLYRVSESSTTEDDDAKSMCHIC